MSSRLLATFLLAGSAGILSPRRNEAQQPAGFTAAHYATPRFGERLSLRADLIPSVADTGARSSRRATIAGAVIGAVVGGLGTAAVVLNVTAGNCITSGPPCPRKNLVFLHTVTIGAGAIFGGAGGAQIGRWLARKL